MNKSLEDNPWFIGGIIFGALGLIAIMGYFIHQSEIRSDAKYSAYQKELEARPIRDLRNGFIKVNQLNCHPALKGYTKKQLSKLTYEDKLLSQHSEECGVTFMDVRWEKEGILGYSPHFSIFLWRNDEDSNDPGGPLHVKKINIENCQVALKNKPGKVKLIVVEGKCNLMDLAL